MRSIVAPRVGAWIETTAGLTAASTGQSRPSRGGVDRNRLGGRPGWRSQSRPSRGGVDRNRYEGVARRAWDVAPRVGAWIETIFLSELKGAYKERLTEMELQIATRGFAPTNGIESFWSMLKRAHKGTFHKISPKHLDRYVQEFSGKHNVRESGTLAQMRDTVARLVGRNLLYRDLIADNGLSSGARS